MGRMVKNKNLIEFYVDGKTKPYVLDLNTGVLCGLRGSALVNVPPAVCQVARQYVRNSNVMRLLYNGYRPSNYADLYAFADKLDAIGYTAGVSDLMRADNVLGIIKFKDLAKYLNNGGSLWDYLTTVLEQNWYVEMNLTIDDHFTEPMAKFLYNNFKGESKEVIHRFAYYLARGLREYHYSDWELRDRLRDYKRFCDLLEIPMEKGDFFRLYINAKRAYTQKKDTLMNKGIENYQNENRNALAFENDEFIVVIPTTNQELVAEGMAQDNCVGGYGERIANRNCNVVFIRAKSAPEQSYITCEVCGGHIYQYLARFNHRVADENALAFKALYQAHLSTHWGE